MILHHRALVAESRHDCVYIRLRTLVLLRIFDSELINVIDPKLLAHQFHLRRGDAVILKELRLDRAEGAHGIDDRTAGRQRQHLIVNGLKITFDGGFFDFPDRRQFIEGFILNRAGNIDQDAHVGLAVGKETLDLRLLHAARAFELIKRRFFERVTAAP